MFVRTPTFCAYVHVTTTSVLLDVYTDDLSLGGSATASRPHLHLVTFLRISPSCHSSKQDNVEVNRSSKAVHLLDPDNSTEPVLLLFPPRRGDLHAGHEVAQLTSLGVPPDDGDVAARLAADGDEVAGLVDLERAREPGVGVRRLDPRDIARGGVDLVRGERVLLRTERLVRAVRRVQEIARHVHLGGLGTRRQRAAGVRGLCPLSCKREAFPLGVRHTPGRDRVAQLVYRVQHQTLRGIAAARRPEGPVTGPVAGFRLPCDTGCQFPARRVDAEDADEIRAEVRHEEEFPCRIDLGCVWVRGVLARVRAWLRHVELELLKHLPACPERECVGGEGGWVTVCTS